MRLDARRLLKLGSGRRCPRWIWAVTLRPQVLGGGAMYIVVRGNSMEPTYQTGDLVIVESAATFAVGDVVAYRVPSGEIGEGHVIVHRIVSGDATTGFGVRGDNNNAPDPWTPRIDDIAGKAWYPGAGPWKRDRFRPSARHRRRPGRGHHGLADPRAPVPAGPPSGAG